MNTNAYKVVFQIIPLAVLCSAKKKSEIYDPWTNIGTDAEPAESEIAISSFRGKEKL